MLTKKQEVKLEETQKMCKDLQNTIMLLEGRLESIVRTFENDIFVKVSDFIDNINSIYEENEQEKEDHATSN